MLLMLLGMVFVSGGLYVDSVDSKCDPSEWSPVLPTNEDDVAAMTQYEEDLLA